MSTAPYIREPTPAFSPNSWTQGEFRSSGITKERAPLYERLLLSGGPHTPSQPQHKLPQQPFAGVRLAVWKGASSSQFGGLHVPP